MSKWCNEKNKGVGIAIDSMKNDDKKNDSNLIFRLDFSTQLDWSSDANGNILCEKMKWINTMVNSLSMSENGIDFGDMITKNIVDDYKWGYNTKSKFNIQLNSCITINGTIQESYHHCCFEMSFIIQLLQS